MKNIAIIGLSSFGYYLCKTMGNLGMNIMAVDIKEELVNQVRPYVRKAVVGDAKDKNFLMKIGITDFDTVVISVGSKIDVSILITLFMKELNIREVIAKANTEDHEKILLRLGATSVVFPERDTAVKMAHKFSTPDFLEYIQLTEGFSLIEVSPSINWLGKKLKDLDLRNRFQIQIVMVRELVPERSLIPDGEFIMKDSDILYVIGKDENIAKLQNELNK